MDARGCVKTIFFTYLFLFYKTFIQVFNLYL